MQLAFVTTNQKKFDVLSQLIITHGIQLVHENLETPEIQNTTLTKVAEFSAQWASTELNEPVLVNDFGYFIPALKGFPGPFSKQVIEWFTLEDWIRLLSGISDRSVVVKWAYAIAASGKQPQSVEFIHQGILTEEPGAEGWNPLHQLFIPDGFTQPFSELSNQQREELWGKRIDHKNLADFVRRYLR